MGSGGTPSWGRMRLEFAPQQCVKSHNLQIWGASQGQILQPLVLLAGGCHALRAHTGRDFGEQLKVEMQTEGSEQRCTWKT